MQDNTYVINSVDTYQGNPALGFCNITYQLAGIQYTQDLMNLPTSDSAELKVALDKYVADAKVQLVDSIVTTPVAVQDLVGQTQQVS